VPGVGTERPRRPVPVRPVPQFWGLPRHGGIATARRRGWASPARGAGSSKVRRRDSAIPASCGRQIWFAPAVAMGEVRRAQSITIAALARVEILAAGSRLRACPGIRGRPVAHRAPAPPAHRRTRRYARRRPSAGASDCARPGCASERSRRRRYSRNDQRLPAHQGAVRPAGGGHQPGLRATLAGSGTRSRRQRGGSGPPFHRIRSDCRMRWRPARCCEMRVAQKDLAHPIITSGTGACGNGSK